MVGRRARVALRGSPYLAHPARVTLQLSDSIVAEYCNGMIWFDIYHIGSKVAHREDIGHKVRLMHGEYITIDTASQISKGKLNPCPLPLSFV